MPRQGQGSAGRQSAAGNATIRDVARRAGVSVATVSRVLNGSGPVRELTRQGILEAARELRFTPNASAQNLSNRRTTAIGVVLPDLYGEFFSELLRGADRMAQRHGRHLLVSSSHHGADGIAAALRTMHGRVDGLIVMAPDIPVSAVIDGLPDGVGTVMLNCEAPPSGADSGRIRRLGIDNFGGAVAMVRHLAAAGHQRIAFIAGAEHNEDAAERHRGYLAAMHEHGLDTPSVYQPRGDFTEAGGHSAAQLLLSQSPMPTAIFAANDIMALGALVWLREQHVRVPDDIAVVGFDDIPTARYVSPPLTTVAVDVTTLGERAVTLLLHEMTEPRFGGDDAHRVAHHEVLPTALVVRASCGAALPPP